MTNYDCNAHISRFVTNCLENGGDSVQIRNGRRPWVDGYMVGGVVDSMLIFVNNTISISEIIEAIDTFVALNWGFFEIPGSTYALGGWIDGGIFYVDISQHVTSYQLANNYANKRGELAFYDVAAGESVYVKDVQITKYCGPLVE